MAKTGYSVASTYSASLSYDSSRVSLGGRQAMMGHLIFQLN
jgi:hypothetical protein